MTNTCEL